MLEFGPGLNVIYGASETGKSFVLEAIDFMLGGKGPLRDISERVGYDRVLLGLEFGSNEHHTLVRSTDGGSFQLYSGLHQSVPVGVEAQELASKHSATNRSNISSLLLDSIGLGDKRVRRNRSGDTQNLSFRNLCRLCLVSEEEIHKQSSPLLSGQYTEGTLEYSVFKLLLTGTDDSALVAVKADTERLRSSEAKLELLDELITALENSLERDSDAPEEVASQLSRLEAALNREQSSLQATESEYSKLAAERRQARDQLSTALDRRGELDELLARFHLLQQHYDSDLARLDGVEEAGTLVESLSSGACPLCGAQSDDQHLDGDCDGNIAAVLAGARTEKQKIAALRQELLATMEQLRSEAVDFDSRIPAIEDRLSDTERSIEALRPALTQHRASYTELVDKRSSLRATLAAWDQLADLRARREQLLVTDGGAPEEAVPELPSARVDEFAQNVLRVLQAWQFPNATRAHFDQDDRDLVIDGRRRGSRGKGMRAITHAAFTVGLMGFCQIAGTSHPGFVVLDSPLLAYREPEGEDDDLSGTGVQDAFYDHLAAWNERQVIVIENENPPEHIRRRESTVFFSKSIGQDRYGFFPVVRSTELELPRSGEE